MVGFMKANTCIRWAGARRRQLMAGGFGLAAALFTAGAAYPEAPESRLAGHQAIYRVSLASAAAGSGMADISGAVVYRFADTCDGWAVENRVALRFARNEGDQTDSVWIYTSWESKDGRAFRFRMRDTRNGETVEELGGEASMPGGDGPGVARLTVPWEADVELPAGTQFPMAHLLGLFEKARAGERYVPATVFDGADLDNPYYVGAVIGPASPEKQRGLTEKLGIGDLPIWAVRLAFFPGGQSGAVPKFEVGVDYREDGIAAAVVQDFGDFAIDLTLEKLELFPDPDC